MDLFGGISKNDKPFRLRIYKSDKAQISIAKKRINRNLDEKRNSEKKLDELRSEIEIVKDKYNLLAEEYLFKHGQTAVLYLNGLTKKLKDSKWKIDEEKIDKIKIGIFTAIDKSKN